MMQQDNTMDTPVPVLQPEEATDQFPEIEKEFLTFKFGNLQGIGARDDQEDAFAFSNILDEQQIEKNGVLAVVADGMGGLKNGKLASNTGVSVIRKAFSDMDVNGDIPAQLNAAMHIACAEVAKATDRKGGCTAIAVVIKKDLLYFSSVGDSYIFLKRGELLTRLNRHHNIRQDALMDVVLGGSADPQEAFIDDKPEALTQFLGKAPLTEIDCFLKPLKLRYGDVVMICSDGVGGVLEEQMIHQCLGKASPSEMCAALEEGVLARRIKYQDNYTALVIQCVYN